MNLHEIEKSFRIWTDKFFKKKLYSKRAKNTNFNKTIHSTYSAACENIDSTYIIHITQSIQIKTYFHNVRGGGDGYTTRTINIDLASPRGGKINFMRVQKKKELGQYDAVNILL